MRQNYRRHVERTADILNECFTSRTWGKNNIETAYRIGDRRRRGDQPRPLIVRYHWWSDKMEVLNDTVARGLLRHDGIRVSSELTTRQRDEVRRYRRQGKVAYYKNDRRQVEERQATPFRGQQEGRQQPEIHQRRPKWERADGPLLQAPNSTDCGRETEFILHRA